MIKQHKQLIANVRIGPNSQAFKGTFVAASSYAKISVFAPSLSPAVFHNPELFSRLGIESIAHNKDDMICYLKRIKLIRCI